MDDAVLAVRSNTGRRILFGAIGAVLLLSFFVGVDWNNDFAGGMVAGTVFFFAVTVICLAVAGWNAAVVFDRRAGEIRFEKSVFGIRVSRASMPIGNVTAVVLQGLRLLRDNEQPHPGLGTSRFRQYMERRTVLFKLMLETDERLEYVEDSSDIADLETAAQTIAEFLGVTYRREDM